MFSTVIWHASTLSYTAPVVFVQSLAAMAVVQAARGYARGYERLRLRLKWPNDVYAGTTKEGGEEGFVKVGGGVVNSSYAGESYGLVVGVGVNVANAAPTTGLDALATQCGLPVFQREILLAKILAAFEELYGTFCAEGWGSKLEDIYYGMWLHA